MVKLNIKKFSRSKEDKNDIEIINTTEIAPEVAPPKRRGRKPKAQPEPELIEPDVEIISEPEPEPEVELIEPDQEEDNDFLNDLNNENFIIEEKPTKGTPKEEQNESAKIMKQLFKKPKKEPKLIRDDDSLFDEDATPILGKDKRVLVAKLHQYKNLFPDELKKFKIKPNSSPEQMKACLSEMEAIVETSSVDQFMTDSILQCIKLVEAGTTRTRYNISGTADMLKQNPQFHNLIKQLYVKYNVFSKIPPEFQLVLLVGTTAVLCKTKNDKKIELNDFLNQPIK
jgi:hypothetical protein